LRVFSGVNFYGSPRSRRGPIHFAAEPLSLWFVISFLCVHVSPLSLAFFKSFSQREDLPLPTWSARRGEGRSPSYKRAIQVRSDRPPIGLGFGERSTHWGHLIESFLIRSCNGSVAQCITTFHCFNHGIPRIKSMLLSYNTIGMDQIFSL
jgi:hypothetical protein